MYNVKPSSNFL